VKSDCDQDPPQPSRIHQTQTTENDFLPTKTTEEIQTEHGEGCGVSEPNSELQPLSSVNADCSPAQNENSELQPLSSVLQLRMKTVKVSIVVHQLRESSLTKDLWGETV
jgi:hypothetical protein